MLCGSPTVRDNLLKNLLLWCSSVLSAPHQYVPLSSAVTSLTVTVIFFFFLLSFIQNLLFLLGSLVLTKGSHIDGSSPLQINFVQFERVWLYLHQYVKFSPTAGDLVKLLISVENRGKHRLVIPKYKM